MKVFIIIGGPFEINTVCGQLVAKKLPRPLKYFANSHQISFIFL